MIRYSDIYKEDFLNLFDKAIAKRIGNLVINEARMNVNVNKIAQLVNLHISKIISYDDLSQLKTKENAVLVNITKNKAYQRYVIAKGIADKILKQNQLFDANYDRALNQFAPELLMPQKLIKMAIRKYIKQTNNDRFTNDTILTFLSHELKVNRDLLEYRLKAFRWM